MKLAEAEHAAKSYKSIDSHLALECYHNNRLSSAAKLWKEIAMILEKNHQLNEADNSSSLSANPMLLKVAELMTTGVHPNYSGAIDIYEKISACAIENSAMKWSVKSYLFKACLCDFALLSQANNIDSLEDRLHRYSQM